MEQAKYKNLCALLSTRNSLRVILDAFDFLGAFRCKLHGYDRNRASIRMIGNSGLFADTLKCIWSRRLLAERLKSSRGKLEARYQCFPRIYFVITNIVHRQDDPPRGKVYEDILVNELTSGQSHNVIIQTTLADKAAKWVDNFISAALLISFKALVSRCPIR